MLIWSVSITSPFCINSYYYKFGPQHPLSRLYQSRNLYFCYQEHSRSLRTFWHSVSVLTIWSLSYWAFTVVLSYNVCVQCSPAKFSCISKYWGCIWFTVCILYSFSQATQLALVLFFFLFFCNCRSLGPINHSRLNREVLYKEILTTIEEQLR